MIKLKNKRDILNIKPKSILKIGSAFMAVSLFSGLLAGTASYAINRETIVAVSNNVRESMYMDNEYLDFANYYQKEIKEDKNITDKALENTNLIKLDMLENNDISFLTYCSNLETLIIHNAQDLTANDIELISQNSVNDVRLIFDHKKLCRKLNDKLDFSLLTNKKPMVLCMDYFSNEQEKILFINYLQKHNINLPDNGYYDEALKINTILDKIIESLKLNESQSNWEKFIKICSYVTNRIEYDSEISSYIYDNGSFETDSPIKTKAHDYNENALSAVISEDITKEVPGICVNYSNLLNALCIKAGIEAYIAETAVDSDKAYHHSWNVVKVDEDYQYVDLTAEDSSFMYEAYLEEYLAGGNINFSQENYSNWLKGFLLQDLDEAYQDFYDPPVDFDKILYPEDKKIITINENINGDKTFNGKMNYGIFTLIGLGNGLFIMVVYSKVKEKAMTLIKKK